MDSCGGQLVGNLLIRIALQEQLEHISDTLRFFGDNNISLQVLIILIAENVLVCSTDGDTQGFDLFIKSLLSDYLHSGDIDKCQLADVVDMVEISETNEKSVDF